MKILVTGGAGYIGSIASHSLIEKGYEVSVLDDLSTGKLSNISSGVTFFEGSVLDEQITSAALQGCSAVIHFAGKSLVGESVLEPELYQEINVEGSKNLLNQMRINKVKKIVFSSSAAVYGNAGNAPINEVSRTAPTNPYGQNKLDVEELITEESERHGLSAISLRYFNVAGAKKIDAGWLLEQHDPETHLIPNVIRSVENDPVTIFGSNLDTPDGTCVRDYVHVDDLVDAHILSLNKLTDPKHLKINLGSGSGFSVKKVITTASGVLERDIPCIYGDRRPGDPEILVADISAAEKILSWVPHSTLDKMVRDAYLAYKWFSNN